MLKAKLRRLISELVNMQWEEESNLFRINDDSVSTTINLLMDSLSQLENHEPILTKVDRNEVLSSVLKEYNASEEHLKKYLSWEEIRGITDAACDRFEEGERRAKELEVNSSADLNEKVFISIYHAAQEKMWGNLRKEKKGYIEKILDGMYEIGIKGVVLEDGKIYTKEELEEKLKEDNRKQNNQTISSFKEANKKYVYWTELFDWSMLV